MSSQSANDIEAYAIVKKYIDRGVKFVVRGNIYAEWMRKDIAAALDAAEARGRKTPDMGREINTKAAYGDPREFTEGSNRVKALPFVGLDGKILRIVIAASDGDRHVIEQIIFSIQRHYEGALYSTWQLGT